MSQNLQPGIHPDADQLSVFVEGAATAREQERMLAHLAECAECRKAVFLMQPHEETQAATAMREKRWIWRRLLPVALPAAALACALIAVLIYIRPHGGRAATPQPIAIARQPELQRPGATAAPAIDLETAAPSGRSEKDFERKPTAPSLPRQEKRAVAGVNLPKSGGGQMAANVKSQRPMAAAPSVSVPVIDQAVVAGTITPRGLSDLPVSGRDATNLAQLSPAPQAQAAAQNNRAEKKDLLPLNVERAGRLDSSFAGVSGHITDRSGAVVPGVTVTLRDAGGKTRQTTTGTDGSFHLTEIPAGQYELIATARGFTTKQQAIELQPSELAMLQPVLDVGAMSEAVTVEATGAAVPVQSKSSTESGTITEKEATNLALDGRNFSQLVSLLPVAATVSQGKRFLSLDSAGNLFLSRNGGKKWKKINPQWAGKAVRIELAPPASAGAAFRVTTDAGVVWTSKDGTHWHPQ